MVSEALDLVNEGGLAKLNMRALAARLAVQQSALYWHVRNKEQLLGLMVGALHQRALEATPDTPDWREWLVGFAHALREILRTQRDASKLSALAGPLFEDQDAAAREFENELIRRGVPASLALPIEASIVSLVLGWLRVEENVRLRERLDNLLMLEQAFGLGLTAMVSGFALDQTG